VTAASPPAAGALILAVETSCDDTSAAVVRGREVLASIVSSQNELHAQFGGVVPEVASRRHTELVNEVVAEAMSEAGIGWDHIAAVAVTQGPGLIGALLVGLATAKSLAYRRGLPPLDLRGQSVVLVDDGLATGATMLAAVRAARAAGAAFVVVAAPVASDEAATTVGAEADQIAILQVPPLLFAIGAWYRDFDQLDDADVCRLLALAREKGSEPVAATQDTA
jgi:hypothetical protein